MVKLTGPMHSQRASGTLAGQLCFGFSGKNATARKKPTPKQPRSGLQISMRAMMTFLAQQWKNLTDDQQATWDSCASHTRLDAYHRYLGQNLERWRTSRGPTKQYPAEEKNIPGGAPECIAAGGPRHATITAQIKNVVADNWLGILLHSKTADPDLDVDKLIHVYKIEDLDPHYWTHSPLAPGTHYYHIWYLTDDGSPFIGNNKGDTATVT